MRFLGIGKDNELGDMYLRLQGRGHEVRVFVDDESSQDIMAGMIQVTDDWRRDIGWIREAGNDGFILFETAEHGDIQDELRADGFNVIGGSRLGDRLESDRAYAQEVLGDLGIRTAATHDFDNFDDAIRFLRTSRNRYVLKLNGAQWASTSTYTGQLSSGEDMIAVLRRRERIWPDDEPVSFILMEHLAGVEVGVGAFFNGRDFLEPANLDWEHKRFFPGDLGELTGEMGTVVSYRGAEKIFDATLRRMQPMLSSSGYCGYVNLNTIVNEEGIWPLEFTCRFGYPGFPILDSLHAESWDSIFAKLVSRENLELKTQNGFSVGVVITVPPFPYSTNYERLGKGMPVCFCDALDDEELDAIHFGEVALRDGQLITAGAIGYIAVVTGVGESIEAAREKAYSVVRKIVIPNARYRNDIGITLMHEGLESLKKLGWLQ